MFCRWDRQYASHSLELLIEFDTFSEGRLFCDFQTRHDIVIKVSMETSHEPIQVLGHERALSFDCNRNDL